MQAVNFDGSNCDVIVDLLRAEHEQVKQRTDIIKQLISLNCCTSSSKGKTTSGPHVYKHENSEDSSKNKKIRSFKDKSYFISNINMSHTGKNNYGNSIEQNYSNSWNVRHARCFEPLEDVRCDHCCIKNPWRLLEYSGGGGQVKRPSLPSYSFVQKENAVKPVGGYASFATSAAHHSSTRGVTPSPAPTKNNSTKKPASKNSTKNIQTEEEKRHNKNEEMQCDILDYKLEVNKLLQQMTDLRLKIRQYEEDKIDWIAEKRKQVILLQKLRDASCEETQSALKLTNWKPGDNECYPNDYEEAKRNWLLCKKLQIELLEKLRTVSLCEIKKSLDKLNCSNSLAVDCEFLADRSKSLNKCDIFEKELYPHDCKDVFENEAVSIKLCNSHSGRKSNIDNDKVNINIITKQLDSNCSNQNNISNVDSEKETFEHVSSDNKLSNQTLFWKTEVSTERELIDLRKKIEDKIGVKLFQNTYNMLKKLNCPQLILSSSKGDSDIGETVLMYLLAERRIKNEPSLVVAKDIE